MREVSGVYHSCSSTSLHSRPGNLKFRVPTLLLTSMFVVFWEDAGAFQDGSSSSFRGRFLGILFSDDAAPIHLPVFDCDAMVIFFLT
ncbi:hypothetical protein M758_UG244500 [Ceratodon purpureus]|nr:hypothetical protein M758_UG244500 [Ceratodon purpureus]